MNLKPGTMTGPGLGNSNAAHLYDIPGECKIKAGMVPGPVLEDPLFFTGRNTDTIVLKEYNKLPVVKLAGITGCIREILMESPALP